MSIDQPALGRDGLCVPGGREEPTVPAAELAAALEGEELERLRPLLPVGYAATAEAYLEAARLSPEDLSAHYTEGLEDFSTRFVPILKRRLEGLAGWRLDDFVAYAAGSDVDLMTHVVREHGAAAMYPGDWYGFGAGLLDPARVTPTRRPARDRLACLCVPSVRNGHLTADMLEYLDAADHSLLNVNLLPTLHPAERRAVGETLAPRLDRALISVSFSRGFGLTASQLGVLLVHRDHPLRARFHASWTWLGYFYNRIAARAFERVDLDRLGAVDEARRAWVRAWLEARGLPALESGTYYVRAFRPEGEVPERLRPVFRDGLLRLCPKPPIVELPRVT